MGRPVWPSGRQHPHSQVMSPKSPFTSQLLPTTLQPRNLDDQVFAHKLPKTTHQRTSCPRVAYREPRRGGPASPLQQQRLEECCARASDYLSEKEDTPPTSLVSTDRPEAFGLWRTNQRETSRDKAGSRDRQFACESTRTEKGKSKRSLCNAASTRRSHSSSPFHIFSFVNAASRTLSLWSMRSVCWRRTAREIVGRLFPQSFMSVDP